MLRSVILLKDLFSRLDEIPSRVILTEYDKNLIKSLLLNKKSIKILNCVNNYYQTPNKCYTLEETRSHILKILDDIMDNKFDLFFVYSTPAFDLQIIKKCGVTLPNRMIFIADELAMKGQEIAKLLFYITFSHEILHGKKFLDILMEVDEKKNILKTSPRKVKETDQKEFETKENPLYREAFEDTGDFFEDVVIGFRCQTELGNDFANLVLESKYWENIEKNEENQKTIMKKYNEIFEKIISFQNYDKLQEEAKDEIIGKKLDFNFFQTKQMKKPESLCLHIDFEGFSEIWEQVTVLISFFY